MTEGTDLDMIKLQEVILQRIHEQERKILERVKTYQDLTDKKLANIESAIELHESRGTTHQSYINSHKLLIDKIPEIEKNLSLNIEDTFMHKCKIIQIEKDLSSSCKKYDKIFFDNLILPGIIGDGNRYQNVRDYIEVLINIKLSYININNFRTYPITKFYSNLINLYQDNIKTVNNLVDFKEKHKIELKSYKDMIDQQIKAFCV